MPRTAEVKFLDKKRVGIVELIEYSNCNYHPAPQW